MPNPLEAVTGAVGEVTVKLLSAVGLKGDSNNEGSDAAQQEGPGQDQATLAAADNAGVEAKGAVKDEADAAGKRTGGEEDRQLVHESSQSPETLPFKVPAGKGAESPAADDGDNVEGIAQEVEAAQQKSAEAMHQDSAPKPGDASSGLASFPVTQFSADLGDTPSMTQQQAQQPQAPSQEEGADAVARMQVPGGQAESKVPTMVKGGEIGSGGAGAEVVSEEQARKEGGLAPVDLHEEVLEKEQEAGKIFTQAPVLPGGGITVHGMMPAAILMHTAENTKRTGGGYKAALEGLDEPSFTAEDKSGAPAVEPEVPGSPTLAAALPELTLEQVDEVNQQVA